LPQAPQLGAMPIMPTVDNPIPQRRVRELYKFEDQGDHAPVAGTGEAPKNGDYAYSAVTALELPVTYETIEEQRKAEYDDIAKKGTVLKDIAADCWGALFFVVVHDFPAIKMRKIDRVGLCRLAFCSFVFIMNLFIQFILLYFICKLLMMPGMLTAQNIYKFFTSNAFQDGESDHKLFEEIEWKMKNEICGLALGQALFVRVILFLWVTNNVGELRSNYLKMMQTVKLPALPEGLDMTLMVVDDPETHAHEAWIICLNNGSKVILCTLIFIPKFVIATALTLLGCLWLIASKSVGDLILNSLALAFVVQVDELIAQVFFPETFFSQLQGLALACQEENTEETIVNSSRVRAFVDSGWVLAVTVAAVECSIQFQPVIPDFKTENVQAACVAFISRQVPWCLPGQTDCFPES